MENTGYFNPKSRPLILKDSDDMNLYHSVTTIEKIIEIEMKASTGCEVHPLLTFLLLCIFQLIFIFRESKAFLMVV